jgi:hypothetical protein
VRKPSVSKGLGVGALAAARGGGLVIGWFALVACLVIACSKETPAQPAPAPSIVTVPSPASASAAPSEALTVSASASESAVASASAPAATTKTATTAASAVASASASSGPKVFACGGGDKPKCPLQSWMNTNMKPAMTSGDPAKVAALLRKIAAMAPAGYAGWAKIANDGAAEVEAKKEVNAAKPSCSKCHEQFKTRWKTEDRDHPI